VAVPSTRFLAAFRGDLAAGHCRLLEAVAPELAAQLAGAQRVGALHGFAGHTGFLRQSWGPGWALVGDAGYFKDPLTAHGITDALRDAELLADAIVAGSTHALAQYQQTRDRLSAALFALTDRIASFDWTMAQLRTLHQALAQEMSQEVRAMAARYGRASRERSSSTQCSTNTICA
jgi:flavin-dependent dehydrogenase